MFSRLLSVLVLLLFFSTSFADAQPAGKIDSLPPRERVQAINRDFYKLYSANFDQARELAEWAVAQSQAGGWKQEEAASRMSLGVITYLSGNYPAALPQYLRSRELFDSLGDASGSARVNNEMAVFYHKQDQLDRALECLSRAESLARKENDLETLGTSLGHRAAFYTVRGRSDEAYPLIREVYDIRLKLRDSVGLGYVLADLAEYHGRKGQLDQAIVYLSQSTEIRKLINDLQGVAVNRVNTGEMYFNARKFTDAARWFQQGLDEALRIGYKDLARFTYDMLARTYVEMGDFRKAYTLQSEARAFSDSLLNLEKTRVIEELQTRYESEKKDNEISRLSQDNLIQQTNLQKNRWIIGALALAVVVLILVFMVWRILMRQRQAAVWHEQKVRFRDAQIRAVIDSQEQERRRFAADLHDGMGQMVAALQLNIRSLRKAEGLEQKVESVENSEQLLSEIQQEIRNIAFNLMPPVLVKEGLVPAVRELARRLNRTAAVQVAVAAYGMPERLHEVTEISLYRVIQELVSNIIRHNRADSVVIGFTGYEDELVLTIEDNGQGYDLSAFQNSPAGNGWRTVQSRLGLIRATFEADTVPGRANSVITIRIPFGLQPQQSEKTMTEEGLTNTKNPV